MSLRASMAKIEVPETTSRKNRWSFAHSMPCRWQRVNQYRINPPQQDGAWKTGS